MPVKVEEKMNSQNQIKGLACDQKNDLRHNKAKSILFDEGLTIVDGN